MSGNLKDKPEKYSSPPIFVTSLKPETILKEIPAMIGHMLKGLFIFLGSKTRNNVLPKAGQLVYRLEKQTTSLIRESIEVGKPKVTEAGQMSKGLLILAARYLKTKGVSLVVWIVQLIKGLSSLSYKKAKKAVGDKVNIIRQDITTEQTKVSAAAAVLPSPEIILKEEETISLNSRLAQEIFQNGIECKAATDIGSLEIEKKPYYSYLFAMSPRIITNRGCIRFEGNATRNIDFIQIIQKN